MLLQELRERKKKLEQDIMQMLIDFESATGVEVNELYTSSKTLDLPERHSKIISINIRLRLEI